MSALRVSVLATIVFAGSLNAQDSSAMAWLREAPHRAATLAGCYRLNSPIRDTVVVPQTFRLTTRPVRALGYHRVASFWTDMPRMRFAETRPIWTPRTADSLEIELAPHSTGMPQFVLVGRVAGDSLRGAYQELSWRADTTGPLGVRLSDIRSVPIRGKRVTCTR